MNITTGGLGSNYEGTPDAIDKHITTTKAVLMTHKQKTIISRFVRNVVATSLGLLAVWLAGPDMADLIKDPTLRSLMMVVVVPTIVAADKALRFGNGSDSSEQ